MSLRITPPWGKTIGLIGLPLKRNHVATSRPQRRSDLPRHAVGDRADGVEIEVTIALSRRRLCVPQGRKEAAIAPDRVDQGPRPFPNDARRVLPWHVVVSPSLRHAYAPGCGGAPGCWLCMYCGSTFRTAFTTASVMVRTGSPSGCACGATLGAAERAITLATIGNPTPPYSAGSPTGSATLRMSA